MMIKRYATGKVSRSIHEQIDSIEGVFGAGLDLQKGINVVITGGTGILPFLDLFDLLLKKALSIVLGQLNTDVDIDVYGVGYAAILPEVSVKLYASFNSSEELNNYQWLIDLHLISAKYKLNLFELHAKVSEELVLSNVGQFRERINQ